MADNLSQNISNSTEDTSNTDSKDTTTNNNNPMDYLKDIAPAKEPAFIFQEDTGDYSAYSICKFICQKVGERYIRGIQLVRNVWRIYFHTNAARIDLINKGITVNEHTTIKVYGSNPFIDGGVASDKPSSSKFTPKGQPREFVKLTRVWIKDLMDSVSDDSVKYMFQEVYNVKLASDIKLGYHRDDQGKLTNWINGDRFVLVHPDQLKKPLPRNAQCGTFKCRLVYKGQFDGQKKECFMCFSTDHQGKNCPNPPCCRVCRSPGHEPGSPKCKHYLHNTNLKEFGGEADPLSNHYKHEFKYKDIPGKTAENHFFFHKSMMNGQPVLARMCHDAPNGRKAKYLSKGIMCCPDWDQDPRAYDLMKDIVKSKVEQVDATRKDLHDAWREGRVIVEAVPNPRDFWWGSSLNKEGTLNTDPEYWPGKNTLGQIYMEIAVEKWGPPPTQIGLMNNVCEGPSVQAELVNTIGLGQFSDIEDTESERDEGEIVSDGEKSEPEKDEESKLESVDSKPMDQIPTAKEISDFVAAEKAQSVSKVVPTETIASKLRAKAGKPKGSVSSTPPAKSKVSPRTTSVKRSNSSPLGNVTKQQNKSVSDQNQSTSSSQVSKVQKSNSKVS